MRQALARGDPQISTDVLCTFTLPLSAEIIALIEALRALIENG
jgi:hypothetical protein